MNDVIEVKKRLRQAVIDKFGSNPTELARRFKVNQKTLNNHINGDVEVSLSTILLILDAFPDLSAEWLLRGQGDMVMLPDGLDDPQDVEIGRLEDENRMLKLLLADRDLEILRLKSAGETAEKRNVV